MFVLGLVASGFVIGTVLGSFVKALADRSLSNRKFTGRSYCVYCKKKLQPYDLFPVLSWLILKGKCRYCHKNIGIEYLLVEVVMGILIGFLFFETFKNFQFSVINYQSIFNFQFLVLKLHLIYKIFFITILSALFLTDIKKMLIPDRIILPSIIIGIIASIMLVLLKISYLYYYLSQTAIGRNLLPPHNDYFRRHAIFIFEPFIYSILAAILIGGFFWGLIIITRGKGMGGGDVKLGAFMGLSLGFPLSLVAVMLGFFSGAVVSVILILLGKKNFGQNIAFGPFLVLGSLIALFWGYQIYEWYLNLSVR